MADPFEYLDSDDRNLYGDYAVRERALELAREVAHGYSAAGLVEQADIIARYLTSGKLPERKVEADNG